MPRGIEGIADELRGQVRAEIATIRSEGFGGDFRSGYEDAFRALMGLMEPRGEVVKGTINIIGARTRTPATTLSKLRS